MIKIQTARPRAELEEFVRVFAQRDVVCVGEKLRQRDIAQLEHILSFDFGDLATIHYTNGQSKLVPRIHVVGSQTTATSNAQFFGHHDGFGIFLKPLACWQLFRIPPAEFANENGHGSDLVGNGIDTLWLRLAERNTFQERIQVAEDYLLPFARNALKKTLILETAQHTYRRRGAVGIQDLAHYSSLSLRQYERRFVTEVGFTPKLFARITRFQTAVDIKRMHPQRSWMSVAHQLGYFDQMHMVHDFHSLAGSGPTELFRQTGDYRPWSLASPSKPYLLSE
ncbi:Transcriptional regulator, AraC family (plasmid) [Acidisarcina polymorpha]|uniref:Transcriptional regulator, AraC family n=1 Tax=Acidisarcina polymorpha TaxID=2211140 RepID=A0A2Z5GBC6_9BACT|nr:helix-turn-helix domain-containing protein [Acidisarcina polymorpha]AXC16107.1 Transcriptional regulator, AraC family [Acidisarcina polymorpha]